jgi:hypothetical protein
MQGAKPVKVEPRRRVSGPRPRLPEGWHGPDYQRRLCESCHLPVIGEITLVEDRWCGPCFTFRILPEREARKPDLPPAA